MFSSVCKLQLLRFTKDVALFSLTIITASNDCFVVVMLVTSFSILDGTQEQDSISQPVNLLKNQATLSTSWMRYITVTSESTFSTFNMEDCR